MLEPGFLDPERLRTFVAVAEAANFTRAAQRLHLTQPAVSTQIRRLEESVGSALFVRDTQSVRLTKDGEAMLGFAREILEVIGRARRQFTQPSLAGSVRFGLVEDFNMTVLPEMLGRLRQEHKNFELSTETGLSRNLRQRLDDGGYDLILATRQLGSARGEFLCRQKLVWCGLPGVLETANGVVPLVLYPPPSLSRETALQTLREHGFRWSIPFESASIMGVRAALLARMGIAALRVGMMPPGVVPLPTSQLPALPDMEYVLEVNPQSKDPVVAGFASILRRVAPLIIDRLAEEQVSESGL